MNKLVLMRNTNKRKAKLARGGKCIICGYNKCLAALHWHHINKNKQTRYKHNGASCNPGKLFTVNTVKALKETKKCALVCANCHSEIHWPDSRWLS